MNKIEKLIEDMCPEGVTHKFLWEVTAWDKRFNAVENHKQSKFHKYTYVLAAQLKTLAVDKGDVKLLSTGLDSPGWTTREVAGDLVADAEIVAIPWGGKAVVHYFSGPFVTADNRIAQVFNQNELSTKFLYYFLLENLSLIESFYRGSGIRHPSMANVLDLRIPLPPLQIQEEIVSILDKFTELEAELEAELAVRVSQMRYFKAGLLFGISSSEHGERFKLADVAEANWGNTSLTKSSYSPLAGEYPAYSATGPDGLLEHFEVEGSGVVLSAIGARCGKTWLAQGKWTCIKNTIWFRSKDENFVMNSWLYWITSDPELWPSSSSAQPFISLGDVRKMELWIPSIEEQKRIVGLMDKFSDLSSSASIGLPAEIQARRQQYEYYRNKLLTFKELKAS
jgi:type I restriction enzyme S subunit